MRADDVHLLQSVSKSITGALTGILVAQGALDPGDRVIRHIPELAGTSFEGATVRHLLDMRAGTRFDETYANPASDLRASEAQFGWAPGPRPAPTALTYLSRLPNHREHGDRFEYRSILTDVLGLAIERAADRPFAEVLGQELWGPLGAGTDAYVTLDADGFPVADGGICVTLRDLARFGRMELSHGDRAALHLAHLPGPGPRERRPGCVHRDGGVTPQNLSTGLITRLASASRAAVSISRRSASPAVPRLGGCGCGRQQP